MTELTNRRPDLFLNMSDAELRRAIEEIDALPEDECHPDTLTERDAMVAALRFRENWG